MRYLLFSLGILTIVSSTGRDVHLMVQGDLTPFLRRVSELPVRDMEMTTPDIEDVFLRFYRGPAGQSADATAAEAAEVSR